MMYKCICGREFDNSQKINAHKKHCLVYLGKDAHSEEYINQMSRMSKIANEHKTQKTKERKEKELEQWISEKHTCEHCGKVMVEKYSTGRFCSRSCANSRIRTNEIKEKISKSVVNSIIEDNIKIPKHRHVSGRYNGIRCDSSLELIFLIYCLDHNIEIERCKFSFPYNKDGYTRHYLPDFYLPKENLIVEIKPTKKQLRDTSRDEDLDIKERSVDARYNYKMIYDSDNNKYLDYFIDKYNTNKASYKEVCRKLLT